MNSIYNDQAPPKRRALRRHSSNGSSIRVDILPLIDVMFLIISFFIVLTMSMVLQKGIPVNLANAKTGESSTIDEKTLVLSINSSGEFSLNKETLSAEELEKNLKGQNIEGKKSLILNADADAKHRAVTTALDISRRSGISNVTFAVSPEKTEDRSEK